MAFKAFGRNKLQKLRAQVKIIAKAARQRSGCTPDLIYFEIERYIVFGGYAAYLTAYRIMVT